MSEFQRRMLKAERNDLVGRLERIVENPNRDKVYIVAQVREAIEAIRDLEAKLANALEATEVLP